MKTHLIIGGRRMVACGVVEVAFSLATTDLFSVTCKRCRIVYEARKTL